MAYAKSEAMQPTPLIKAAVQLDLLEVGKEYTASVVLRAGKIRSRQFVVLGCYPDYYSIRDLTNGRVETLRKSDIHCGIIKIEGLNIKEKVLEAVEDLKVKEAERVKVNYEMINKAVNDGYEWIISNPGQVYFTTQQCKEFDYTQRKKIIEGIWAKLVYNGYENSVEQVSGHRNATGFKYNPFDSIKGVDPEPVRIEDAKPEPIAAVLESTKELLRLEKLEPDEKTDIWTLLMSTYSLLQITGKNVVMDVVFKEV